MKRFLRRAALRSPQREQGNGTAGEKWTIYWNEYSSNTYLYGSEISYHAKDDVEFSNELMPPGTVIKQWYSRTYYQLQRIEPALPMIDGEGEYRLRVHIDCPEGERWLIQLVFFDKYDAEAGRIAIGIRCRISGVP